LYRLYSYIEELPFIEYSIYNNKKVAIKKGGYLSPGFRA